MLNSAARGASTFNGVDDVHGSLVSNLAEDDVATVQPVGHGNSDEELGAVARSETLLVISLSAKEAHQEAYVLGPALAMDSSPGLVCLSLKFSSANFSP